MTEHHETFNLFLSPNVRLRMTAAEEMRLDKDDEIFDDDLHRKYIEMHRETVAAQERSIRSLALADIGLSLILFGKNVKIPGVELGLQDIPAATEVLTVIATFSFLTLCMAFVNAQSYQAILEQFANRKALKLGIDPDFIIYGDVLSQAYLKAFRPKMNVYGSDYFVPRRKYRLFYGTLTMLLLMSWLSILVLHLIVVGAGVRFSIGDHWAWWPFAGAIVVVHVAGIAVNLLLNFKFDARYRAAVDRERLALGESDVE